MNTEQIIKALECCGSNPPKCSTCDYRGKIGKKDCYDYLKADALALIKELQAHNENHKKENKYLRERLAEEAEIKEDTKGK
jgi:hypothetical protein